MAFFHRLLWVHRAPSVTQFVAQLVAQPVMSLALCWGLALGVLVPGAWAADAAKLQYRFKQPSAAETTPMADQVLTAEERAFLNQLPEIRVGLFLPPTRPYDDISADGEITGIHAEMLVALASTFGIKLKPVVLPNWPTLLQAARDQKVDLVMTLAVTRERMQFLAFTLGVTPLPGALVTRTGAGTQVDPSQTTFALERDYMVNDWVHRQYPNSRVVTVETTAQALRAVRDGAADAYLGSLLEIADQRLRDPVAGIEVNRLLSFGTGYYHFGVRKDWAPLAAILNKGIQPLRASTTDQLAATLGGLATGAALRMPLAVTADESQLLATQPVWRVGGVRGLSLLNEVDERGLHSGIAAEYTEQLAQRLGVAVDVVAFDSFADMLDGLRKGSIDLVPLITRTPKRTQEFAFSNPYVDMPYVLMARSDSAYYWSLDSLRGKTIVLRRQHPMRELLASYYPDIRVLGVPTAEAAMEQVINGGADATVEVKLLANLRISAPGGERLRVVAEVAELPSQYHFASTNANAQMLSLVNKALADIPASERQRMMRRWVAVDLNPAFPWRRHAPLLAASGAFVLVGLGTTAWWVRRMRLEVQARRRSEQLLSDIANTMPGVAFRYVLGAGGKLRHHFFTPGARAFLGVALDPNATALATLAPRLNPQQLQAALAEQAKCALTGEPFKMAAAYNHPDGGERWLVVNAVQSKSRRGNPVWTGYIVDMTAERELQQRLVREADAHNLMLASASHELRAPTHTLSLALQSLPQEGLSEQQRGTVQVAQTAAHTLSELLSDVLDAARSGASTLQLRPRSFDLHKLLDDVAGAWRSAAGTKGLTFNVHIDSQVPQVVHTDPLRLKQVLTNLLSNACKYTQHGGVSLFASIDDASGSEAVLQLLVADTGIGISPAEQALLFQPFVTLNDPMAAAVAQDSSGLGLAMSRKVATLLGGTITLASQPGHGTRVTLCLPLQALVVQAPGGTGSMTQPAPTGVAAGTVLVCDDDETSRLLLAHMLRQQGLQMAETASSAQALALWRAGGVQALVTDLDMPGMGGVELMQIIRREETSRPDSGARTPIIVCSGSQVPTFNPAGEAALYDAYLVKPVDLHTLTATLRQLGVVQAAPALRTTQANQAAQTTRTAVQ
jgi:two-component system, NarL family, sensor histidine kinase EvgS